MRDSLRLGRVQLTLLNSVVHVVTDPARSEDPKVYMDSSGIIT